MREIQDRRRSSNVSPAIGDAAILVVQNSEQQSASVTAQGVAFRKVSVFLNRNASDQSDKLDVEHQ